MAGRCERERDRHSCSREAARHSIRLALCSPLHTLGARGHDRVAAEIDGQHEHKRWLGCTRRVSRSRAQRFRSATTGRMGSSVVVNADHAMSRIVALGSTVRSAGMRSSKERQHVVGKPNDENTPTEAGFADSHQIRADVAGVPVPGDGLHIVDLGGRAMAAATIAAARGWSLFASSTAASARTSSVGWPLMVTVSIRAGSLRVSVPVLSSANRTPGVDLGRSTTRPQPFGHTRWFDTFDCDGASFISTRH